MCLLVMVSRLYDDAPLVVGANRDERLDRPAISMTVLQEDGPRILGGRDLEAGGTWLAVNDRGVVAALTNLPVPQGRDSSKRTRGELPLALAQHADAPGAATEFADRFRPSDYNPAWLLVGDRASLFSVEMKGAGDPVVRELARGLHVLENLPLGSSSPKVDHIRDLLGPVGTPGSSATDLLDRLRSVLSDHSLPEGASEEKLQRRIETVAACVHSDDYGTRSSTVISVPADADTQTFVSVADGPPCSTSFVDVSDLWRGDR